MIRVGINGLGRIGRSIFRQNILKEKFEIVLINDVNPSTQNLAYLINYDSIYSRFEYQVNHSENSLIVNNKEIPVTKERKICDVPWSDFNVDIVIDASGVHENVIQAHKLKDQNIKKCIITHSPEEVDKTVILGVNDNEISENDFVISSSICDANAFAPVANILDKEFGIEFGSLTTLHPWLSYQNLSDGPCRSFAYPGEVYENFSLGRASTEALIPKTTSCIKATDKVLPKTQERFQSISYRVPTPIVSSADMLIKLNKKTTTEEVKAIFQEAEKSQKYKIIHNNQEPLISKDFIKTDYSVIIDQRWTDVSSNNTIKMMLWYDNEWGYSSSVVDLTEKIGESL